MADTAFLPSAWTVFKEMFPSPVPTSISSPKCTCPGSKTSVCFSYAFSASSILLFSLAIYFVSYLPMLFSVKNSLYILAISVIASVVFSSIALLQILSINPSKILKN